MARIIRDRRSWRGRAHPAAAGGGLAALLLLGAWWAVPRAGPPAREAAAAPETRTDSPRASLPASPAPPGSAIEAPTAISLERIELAPSGRIAAVLRVNGGSARRHLQGDALGVGVRVAGIDVDGIQVEANGRLKTYPLPPGAHPLRADVLQAQVRPVTWSLPMPPTPAVAQMLQSPTRSGVVEASPDRANPARSGIDRLVVDEAMRLSAH